MALDLSGFNSEQQTFGGLYKLGDNLERNRYRKEQEYQKNENTKTSNSKYLNEYFDPKEYLTGSIYDKQTTLLVQDALNKAQELNKQGLPLDEITMAVSPLVNKANRYVASGKAYTQQKKQALELAGKIKGIDLGKLSSQMDNYAFPINEETGQRDVDAFDPNQDYADRALREGNIYNEDSFDEYMKTAGKNSYKTKLKITNGRGGYDMNNVEVTSPSFMIPDSDELGRHIGFVPKYEIATSGGEPVSHDWDSPKGSVKAPVRMITQDVYNELPTQSKAFLRQEGIKYAKMNDIEPSSPEVDNFQRALAYTQLKGSHKISSSFKQYEEKKDTPIKIYTGGGGSKPTEKEKSRAESANYLHKTLDDTAPDENGNLDATELLAGINILSPLTKKPLKPEQSVYNPQTKVFTFTSDGVEEKIPFHKLYSLAATANSGIDKDWLKGFETYSRGENAKNEPVKPKEEKVGFLGSLMNFGKKALEASKQKSKTSVYKGLDKDGNPIFE